MRQFWVYEKQGPEFMDGRKVRGSEVFSLKRKVVV
jgi:hypothetical protein